MVDIIPERNTIKIGPAEALYSKSLEVEDVNYITSAITDVTKIEVKIRYRSPLHKATLYPDDRNSDHAFIEFDEPQKLLPRSICSFYKGDQVLGGGVIKRPLPS